MTTRHDDADLDLEAVSIDDLDLLQDSNLNLSEQERLISGVGGGALLLYGLSRKSLGGLLLGGLGAAFIHRAVTGHCKVYERFGVSSRNPEQNVAILETTLTINRPVSEVYAFYRQFENLPRFMKHLDSVTVLSDGRSRWTLRLPGGFTLQWHAEIVEEVENELIRWRSLPHADLANFGEVVFREAPGGRGTELHVLFGYKAGHSVSAVFAKLLETVETTTLKNELRHLKQVLETGEIPTTLGQPSGRNLKTEQRLPSPALQPATRAGGQLAAPFDSDVVLDKRPRDRDEELIEERLGEVTP